MIFIDHKSIAAIGYPSKYVWLFDQLNSPNKIQKNINSNFAYNRKDTCRSFLGVVENKSAHCFEGSVSFAYILLYLHGYNPKVVLIQAENDVDHTIVVYRSFGKWGSIAMSSHEELKDRVPIHNSLKDLMMTYYPVYTSDYPEYFGQLSMVGFSDPIDLVERFGTQWFFLQGNNALDYLYDHITDNVMCTNIFTDKRYVYPPEV